MAGLLLLAGLAAAAWAWWTGRLGADPNRAMAVAGLGLAALYMAGRGQLVPAAGLGIAAAAFWWTGAKKPDAKDALADAEARQILGLADGATVEDVRAAHRRLIAQVHPDAGGSAELARRVNIARDQLLRNRSKMPPS